MKMKYRILLSCLSLLIVNCSSAQLKSGWTKIKHEPAAKYKIVNEDNIISRADFNEPNDTVRASLIVNDNEAMKIRFSRAEVHGDTLYVVLYEDNEAFYHRFTISIVKDIYSVDYKFLVDISEDTIGTIIPYHVELSLNSLDVKKGRQIRGKIKFRGRRRQSQSEEWITVNGNFKVVL